jgi:hypothetical protein
LKFSTFPSYQNLQPAAQINTDAIHTYLGNTDLFPKDDTILAPVPGQQLVGSTHTADGTGDIVSTPPELYLVTALVQRTVHVDEENQEFVIRGPGSSAVFSFSSGNDLTALTYQWNSAQKKGTVAPRSSDDAYNAILAQLQSAGQVSPVVVNTVEPCYYDSGANFIQPVYYFTATMGNPSAGNKTNARIFGYVPLGSTALETLPDLQHPGDVTPPAEPAVAAPHPIIPHPIITPPHLPIHPIKVRESEVEERGAVPTVTVGRYVVRNDNPAWVASANNFWNQLVACSAWVPRLVTFINAQYYWAYPFEFTTEKETYIDSVNLALTEVHGNWDYFTTYQNWGDGVSISDIPASGYGAGAGGHLAYWILHSCEVIPSAADYPANWLQSFSAWWHVFNGLHAIVGYRTEMWIADGATGPFACAIARGASVVGAWLNSVHSDKAYTPSPGNTYFDGNRQINEPMGRASTIFVCGHADDVVWDLENLGRPGCLQELWYNN